MEWLCKKKCNYDTPWEAGQTFYSRKFSTFFTFRSNVFSFCKLCFLQSDVTRRYFEMAVFYSGRNCKDRGKRRISTVNFAFTRMWTEYFANESFERAWAACICQAYEIAEISPSEIREKQHTGTWSTEFSTLYCDVSERFISTTSYGSGRITKIRSFLFMMMDLWDSDIRGSKRLSLLS